MGCEADGVFCARPDPTIHVSGCSNDTVSNIIQGLGDESRAGMLLSDSFEACTTPKSRTTTSPSTRRIWKDCEAAKPLRLREEGPPGSVTVLIYYWDERPGPAK